MDKQYKKLLRTVLKDGYWYDDPNRAGTKRLQINDYKLTHNFEDGFPILTSKQTYYKGAFGELLSFIRGENNLSQLHKNGVKFWDKDAYNYYKIICKEDDWKPISFEDYLRFADNEKFRGDNIVLNYGLGKLGKIYPHQMRNWNNNIDQIKNLIQTLKENPLATKKTVTMWNPSDLSSSALSPCHWSFEVLITPLKEIYEGHIVDFGKNEKTKVWESPKYGMTIKFHQHSVDLFLGEPLNLVYYSALCYLLSELVNMKPLGIIADLSNVHLYDNAIDGAKKQLKQRNHKASTFKFSEKAKTLFEKYRGVGENKDYGYYNELDNVLSALTVDDFIVENYKHNAPIKVEMLAYKK